MFTHHRESKLHTELDVEDVAIPVTFFLFQARRDGGNSYFTVDGSTQNLKSMGFSPAVLMTALGCSPDLADRWIVPLKVAMARWDILAQNRIAAFLAQIGHESNRLQAVEENLNYSSGTLLRLFGRYFTADTAKLYARKPRAIANKIYANRMGNGDGATGDGYRYRGRGLIQVTGRNNYRTCGQALSLPLEEQPELLIEPRNAAMSAGWYWTSHGCNALADTGQFKAITRVINGGLNGQTDREVLWQRTRRAMGIQ